MAYTHIFTDIINTYLPEPHASLLNGIVFGLPLKSDKLFSYELKRVGLTHLVVLSGMNITILCSLISCITAKFSKKTSILITIFSIIFFIGFVGIQAPIVRAGVMSILTLVSILSGRKSTALYTLVVAGVICIAIWPQWLTSVSFQLSYAATLGLILFGPKQENNKMHKNSFQTTFDYIKQEFKTSMAAQAFTVPIIFLNFKQISLIAPISNIAVSWVVTPLMIFGILTAALGKIHYTLGIIPGYICYFLLSYLIFIIHTLSRLPFTFIEFR
jgi:competence protein ComEC